MDNGHVSASGVFRVGVRVSQTLELPPNPWRIRYARRRTKLCNLHGARWELWSVCMRSRTVAELAVMLHLEPDALITHTSHVHFSRRH